MYKNLLKAARTEGVAAALKYSDEEIDKLTEDEAKAALKKCMKGDGDDDDDGDAAPASAAAFLSIMRGCPEELQMCAAKQCWSENRCRAEALDYIRASRPGAGVGVGGRHGDGYQGGVTSNHLIAGLLLRAGQESVALKSYGSRILEETRSAKIERMSLQEVLQATMRMQGVDPAGQDLESMIRASGSSTVSFPNVLANVLGKLLEQTWLNSPATWRSWCAVRQAQRLQTSIEHTGR